MSSFDRAYNDAFEPNKEEIKELIEIAEKLYDIWLTSLTERLNNLKRINVDSLTKLIKFSQESGEIKTRQDVIRYIEGIIQD